MAAPMYVVLLHYPMLNRKGEVVVTSVTNLDIHDISRSSRTYGAKRFFIVTPLKEQHEVVNRILGHWNQSQSRAFHPDRTEALSVAHLVSSFEDVKNIIKQDTGEYPEVILTDAGECNPSDPKKVTYEDLSLSLLDPQRQKPAVIVFGTGWGVAPAFESEIHRRLDPIYGGMKPTDKDYYNHLSVRSAVAIILDRLVSEKSFGKRNLEDRENGSKIGLKTEVSNKKLNKSLNESVNQSLKTGSDATVD